MNNFPWFRMYSEVLHDKKLARVSFKTRQPKALVLGLWVTVLSLANDSPERGRLLISDGIPLTIDEVLFEAGLNEGDSVIIDEFIQANMLTINDGVITVNHWPDRQFASDHSRERVQRYRERQKKQPAVTETEQPVIETDKKQDCNVTVTAQESDTESDKESILPNGNSGKPQVDSQKWNNTNKKIVGDKFLELTQLKPPKKESTKGAWWGWLFEIFEMADKDAAKTCQIMAAVVKYMRDEHLTISSPKSLVNSARVIASGQELVSKNGNRQEAARASPTLTPEQQAAYEKLSREQ